MGVIYERNTEPVQIKTEVKMKVEKFLFSKKLKGKKISLTEFFTEAAEEKLKRESK
jgi:hypothetical protein